jgi:hypothetical protein
MPRGSEGSVLVISYRVLLRADWLQSSLTSILLFMLIITPRFHVIPYFKMVVFPKKEIFSLSGDPNVDIILSVNDNRLNKHPTGLNTIYNNLGDSHSIFTYMEF